MTNPTERLSAALADRYKIIRKLGEGGMASVYLAEDIKHSRNVAVKILRPELAAVIGAERFLTEIKTTANLQHPHILPLFDSGESESFLYYVMPFIDGETLQEKIEREQQLGVDEAVRIASEVADALDYAHRNDVIHRDIKPANILLHDGRPVVADFGIALAISAAGGGRMTETGLSLGTPHYMSPEQASADRDLSARSDVYSLGCVLYEMLAGQPPHTGPSAQSILVRILTENPRAVTELRHTVPAHVAATVTKAIEKLPADRFDSAKAFIDALTDESFTYSTRPIPKTGATVVGAAPAAVVGSGGSKLQTAAMAVLAATTLLFGWMAIGSDGATTATGGSVLAFELSEDMPVHQFSPSISPDGAIVVANMDGIHLRRPGSTDFELLEGTEGVRHTTFSPDGEWLAFTVFTNSQHGMIVKRMPATGGPISTLWDPGPNRGADSDLAWGTDGWIYFGAFATALMRIPQEGGAPDTLLTFSGRQVTSTAALPGDRGLVFTFAQEPGNPNNRVVVMDLDTRDTTTIIEDGFEAQWVDTGHLIYGHSGGALYAVPFDPDRLETTGPPVPVIDDASVSGNLFARFGVSKSGTLVYSRGAAVGAVAGGTTFALIGMDGSVEPLPLEATDHADVSISPDGNKLAYVRDLQVWVYDIDRGSNRQLSEAGFEHHNPIWSPDGNDVVFRSTRENADELFIRAGDGSTPARHVPGSIYSDNPMQWLDDGTILFDTESGPTDIYQVDASGDEPSEALLEADWDEIAPSVSPDGKWLAYLSGETANGIQVFMRRWPDLSGKTRVTDLDGGVRANGVLVWSNDSQTLYFQRAFQVWAAELVDETAVDFQVEDTGVDAQGIVWDTHPDGRLVVAVDGVLEDDGEQEGSQVDSPRLVIVTNWLTALTERLGAGR
jgi:eukaryotic-like serine/threonine-protein kinase